jgi:hypothetical protein
LASTPRPSTKSESLVTDGEFHAREICRSRSTDDAKSQRAVGQDAGREQIANAATSGRHPIDGALHRRAHEILFEADVGKRNIGFQAVYDVPGLPVVADLAAGNETVGRAGLSVSDVHAEIRAAPN